MMNPMVSWIKKMLPIESSDRIFQKVLDLSLHSSDIDENLLKPPLLSKRLDRNKFFSIEESLNLIFDGKNLKFVNDEIPQGNKSNCYLFLS